MNRLNDLKSYWEHVRRIEGELPAWQTLFVTKRGATACEVTRQNAAVLISNGVMRLATEQEIAGHHARAKIRAAAYAATEAARLRTAVVSVDGGKR